jgi:glucokinase
MLGRVLSMLIDILNPEKIVIGGVFMRSHDLLMPHAERIIKKEALTHTAPSCTVLPAKLGEFIGDASALAIAKGDL